MEGSSLLLVLTLAVMVLGLLGSVLPGLPGVPLIFFSALVYSIFTGFENVGGPVIALLGLFAVLAFVADFVGSSYGARRFGASNWGTVGGAVGGIVGTLVGLLFFGVGSLLGLILGTIAGVFLGEYLKRRGRETGGAESRTPGAEPGSGRGDWRRVSRAAGGVFVGFAISAAAQGILGLASVVVFVLALIY